MVNINNIVNKVNSPDVIINGVSLGIFCCYFIYKGTNFFTILLVASLLVSIIAILLFSALYSFIVYKIFKIKIFIEDLNSYNSLKALIIFVIYSIFIEHFINLPILKLLIILFIVINLINNKIKLLLIKGVEEDKLAKFILVSLFIAGVVFLSCQIYEADAYHSYLILSSIVMDRDLDLSNQMFFIFLPTCMDDLEIMKYYIPYLGNVILAIPSFFLAHILTNLLEYLFKIELGYNGSGMLYAFSVSLSWIIYALISSYLLINFRGYFFRSQPVLFLLY